MTRGGRDELDHLRGNRRSVIAHSVLAGIAGLVPVPAVDDYLAEAVRVRMLRRIAGTRQILVEPKAVRALAAEQDAPGWRRVATATGLLAATKRRWRKLFFAVVFTERADEITRTFIVGTLFDHYLARYHPREQGLLSAERATRVRAVIDTAGSGVRRDLLRQAVERAGKRLTVAAARVPEALGELLAHLRRRDTSGAVTPEPEAKAVDQATAHVAAAAEAAEEELTSGGGRLLRSLVSAFDEAIAAGGGHTPASPAGGPDA